MSWVDDEWKDGLSHKALKKVQELESNLDRLRKDHKQKLFQLDALDGSYKKQLRKTEEEKTTSANLARENQSLLESCRDLETKREKLQLELHSKDTRIACIEGQLSHSKTSLSTEAHKTGQIKGELERAQADHLDVLSKLERMQSDYGRLQENCTQQKHQISKYTDKNRSLEGQLKKLQHEVDRLGGSRSYSTSSRESSSEDDEKSIRKRLMSMEAENEKLKTEIKSYKDKVDQSSSKQTDLFSFNSPAPVVDLLSFGPSPKKQPTDLLSFEPQPTKAAPVVDLLGGDLLSFGGPTSGGLMGQKPPVMAATGNDVELKKLVEKLEKEKNDLKSSSHKLELQVQAKSNEIDNMKSQMKDLQNVLEESKKDVQQRDQRIKKLTEEGNTEKSKCEQVNTKLVESERKIKQIGQELECQRHNAEAVRQSLDHKLKESEKVHKQEISEQVQTTTLLEKQLNETKNKMQQEVNHLTNERNNLQSQLERMQAKGTKTEHEVNDLKQKINAAEQGMRLHGTTEGQLNKKISELTKEKDMLASKLEQSTFKLNNVEDQIKKLKQELAQSEGMMNDLRRKESEKDAAIESMEVKYEGRVKELGNMLENLKIQCADLQRKLSSGEDLLKKREREVGELTLKLDTTTMDKETIKEEMQKREKEGRSLHEEISSLKQSHQDLLTTVKREKEAANKLESKVEEKENKLAELQVSTAEMTKTISNLNKQECQLKQDHQDLLTTLKKEKEKVKEFQNQVDEHESKCLQLKESIATETERANMLQKQQASLKQQCEETLRMVDKEKEETKKCKQMMEKSDNTITELTTSLENESLKVSSLQKQETDLLASIEPLKASIASHVSEISTLESNNKKLCQLADAKGAEVRELTDSLHVISSESQHLRDQLEITRTELQDVTKNKSAADDACEDLKNVLIHKEEQLKKYDADLATEKDANQTFEHQIQELLSAGKKKEAEMLEAEMQSNEALTKLAEEVEIYRNSTFETKQKLEEAVVNVEHSSALLDQKDQQISNLDEEIQTLKSEACSATEKEVKANNLLAEISKEIESIKLQNEEMSEKLVAAKKGEESKEEILEVKDIEIKKLQEGASNMKKEVEDLSAKLEDFHKQNTLVIEEKEAKIQLLTNEISEASDELKTFGETLQNLETIERNMLQENDGLKDRVTKLEEVVSVKTSEMVKQSAELHTIEQQFDEASTAYEKTVAELEASKDALTYDSEQMNAIIHNKEEEVTKLESTLEQITKDLEATKTDLTEKETELQAVKNKVEMMEEQLVQNKDIVILKDKDIGSMKASIEEYEKSLDEISMKMKAEIINLEQEKTTFSDKYNKSETIIQQKDSELVSLRFKLENAEEDLEDLQSKSNETLTKLEVLGKEKVKINDKLEAQIVSTTEANKVIEDLKEVVEATQLKLEEVSNSLTSTRNDLEVATDILHKNKEDSSQLLRQKDAELTKMLNDINECNLTAEKKINVLAEENVNLQDQISELESKLVKLTDILQVKEGELQHLQSEKEVMVNERQALQGSLDVLQMDMEDTNDTLGALQEKNQQITEALDAKDQLIKQNVSEFAQIKTGLEEQLMKITAQYDDVTQNITSLNEKVEKSTTLINAKEEEVSDLKQQFETLKEDKDKLQSHLELVQMDLEDKVTDLEDLLEKVGKLESTLQAQKSFNLEKEDAIAKAELDLDMMSKKMDEEVSNLEGRISEDERYIEELKGSLKSQEDDIAALRRKEDSLKDILSKVECEAHSLEIEFNELKDEKDNVDDLLKKEKNNLVDIKNDMFNTKEKHIQEIESLKEEMLEKDQNLNDNEEKIHILESELKAQTSASRDFKEKLEVERQMFQQGVEVNEMTIQKQKKSIEELEHEVEGLMDKLEAEKFQLSTTIAEGNARYENMELSLKVEIEQLESRITNIQKEKQHLIDQEMQKLKDMSNRLEETIECLNTKKDRANALESTTQQQIAGLESKVSGCKIIIEDNENKISMLETQVEELNEKVRNGCQRIEDLQQEKHDHVEIMMKADQEMKTMRAEMENKISSLSSHLLQVSTNLQEKEETLDRVMKENNEIKNDLSHKLSENMKDSEVATIEKESLLSQRENVEKECEELKVKLECMRTDSDLHLKAKEDLEIQFRTLNSSLEDLVSIRDEAELKCQGLLENNEQINSELNTLKSVISDLKTELTLKERHHIDSILSINSEVEALSLEKTSLQESMLVMKVEQVDTMAKLQEAFEDLKDNSVKLEDDLRMALESKTSQIDSYTDMINELRKTIEKSEVEIAFRDEKMKEHSVDCDRVNKEQTNEIERLEKIVEDLTSNLSLEKLSVSEVITEERSRFENMQISLKTEITQLERQIVVSQEEHQHALDVEILKINELETKLEETTECMNKEKDNANKLDCSTQQTIAELECKITEYNSIMKDSETKMLSLEGEVVDLGDKLGTACQKIEDLQQEMHDQVECMMNADKEMKQTRGELEQHIAKLTTDSEMLAKKLEEKDEKLEDAIKERDRLNNDFETLLTENKIVSETAMTGKEVIQSEYEAIEKERDTLKDRLEQVSQEYEEAIKGKQELVYQAKTAMEEVNLLNEIKMEMEVKAECYSNEKEEMNLEIISLKETISHHTEELKTLHQQLSESEEFLKNRILELELQNASLLSMEISLNDDKEKLLKDVETNKESIEVLKENVKDGKQEINDKEIEVKSLTEQVNNLTGEIQKLEDEHVSNLVMVNQETGQLEETIRKQKDENELLVVEIKKLTDDLSIEKSSSADAISELDLKCQEMQKSFAVEIGNADNRILALEEKHQHILDAEIEKVMNVERQLEEAKDCWNNEKDRANNLESSSKQLTAEFETKMSDYNSVTKDNEMKISSLAAETSELSDNLRIACERIEVLQQEKHDQIECMMNADKEMKQARAELEQHITKLTSDSEMLAKKLEEKAEKLDEAIREKERINNDFKALLIDTKLTSEASLTDKEIIQSKFEEIEKERDALKDQLEKVTEDYETIIMAKEELDYQVKTAIDEIEMLNRLKEELETKNQTLLEDDEKMKSKIIAFEERVKELEQELESTEQKQMDLLQENVAKLEEEVSQLKNHNDESQSKIVEMEKAALTHEQVEQKLKTVEDRVTEFDDIQSGLELEIASLKSQKSTLEEENGQLEKSIEMMQTEAKCQVEELNKASQLADSKMKETSEALEAQKVLVDLKGQEIGELEKELKHIQKEFDEIKTSNKLQMKTLEKKIEDNEEKAEEVLKSTTDKFTQEINTLEEKLSVQVQKNSEQLAAEEGLKFQILDLTSNLKEAKEGVIHLEKTNSSLANDNGHLKTESEQLKLKAEKANQDLKIVTRKLKLAESDGSPNTKQRRELEKLEATSSKLRAELVEEKTETERLRNQLQLLEKKENDAPKSDDKLEEFQKLVKKQEKELNELNKDKASLQGKLQLSVTNARRLGEDINKLQMHIQKLEKSNEKTDNNLPKEAKDVSNKAIEEVLPKVTRSRRSKIVETKKEVAPKSQPVQKITKPIEETAEVNVNKRKKGSSDEDSSCKRSAVDSGESSCKRSAVDSGDDEPMPILKPVRRTRLPSKRTRGTIAGNKVGGESTSGVVKDQDDVTQTKRVTRSRASIVRQGPDALLTITNSPKKALSTLPSRKRVGVVPPQRSLNFNNRPEIASSEDPTAEVNEENCKIQ